jgi:eukaryotic-like serine/threonine-protein kinase
MDQLGKYKIRRTLGRGATGIVYEAFDPVIDRTVAIKTILPSQIDGAQYAEVMTRFKREAQAAGRLNHPGIVAIYDSGEEVPHDLSTEESTMMSPTPGGKPAERVAYIAMEFVKGRELRDYFEKGERFTLEVVARIMGEMLDALDHAHSHGVVHRDMKPANMIVLDDGHVKIADFGIAHVEKSELTRTGTLLGTPAYMSPEQFMGHPVDGRSDLFSCGVILYQLLTGEKPFAGDSTTTIMYKVLREEPVPPSQINLALPAELDAVVKKALEKNPNKRFQNGKEFARSLEAAVNVQAAKPSFAQGGPDRPMDDVIHCTHCGNVLDGGSSFCSRCGTRAGASPAPAEAAAMPVPPRGPDTQAPIHPSASPIETRVPIAQAPTLRTGLWISVIAGILIASAGGIGFVAWRNKVAAEEAARQLQQLAVDNERRVNEAHAVAADGQAKIDAERRRAEVAVAQQALLRAIEQEEEQAKAARR